MPVTARLSKLFYERLGEQIANELVEWFNQVDATYRSDLRELNELHFARFDAKLEQRLAELHAKLDAKIDRVSAELNAKIDRVSAELNAKIDRVAGKLDMKIDRATAETKARMDAMASDLHAVLERRIGEQTRWLFLTWASLLIPIVGLWIRG
jgi:DNA anti-recombination protein RmuC